MATATNSIKLVATLMGDVYTEPSARVKYGAFFDALSRRFDLKDIFDSSLHGFAKMINALCVIHPNPRVWKERYYKNLSAFELRSLRASKYLKSIQGKANVVLQIGVLFDSCWENRFLPSVIYTDYTARLAAFKPEAGRTPFRGALGERWIELERQAFEKATHICTRGEVVRRSVIEDYGIPPDRVTAVGGGLNLSGLPTLSCAEKEPVPTALFIGKQFFRKGGDLLLQAFAIARRAVPNARLLLMTAGPVPQNLPLEGVEIVSPTWDRHVVDSLYRRANLFVLPSRLETWGDVLLEAMAYQLPCIGVASDAMEEIIVDGVTGLIVPSGDVQSLAEAMITMFENPELCCSLGTSGRERVESKFTWDRVVDRIAPKLESAISA